MTEAEWLHSQRADLMVWGGRTSKMSSRSLRLLACACCRNVWRHLPTCQRTAVEVVERFADGKATERDLQTARPRIGPSRLNAVYFAAASKRSFRGSVHQVLQEAAALAEIDSPLRSEQGYQVSLVRDVLGNPYRLVPIRGNWRTADVRSLTCATYENRDLPAGLLECARLSILADALEDAGCTDDTLLLHLRSPGPHVRGCWALDLLLEKS